MVKKTSMKVEATMQSRSFMGGGANKIYNGGKNMKTTKKALSVLLAVIMIMSSMSVCFGTFVPTAFAADEDAIGTLADKLKDSAYAETLGLLGKSSKGGSGLSRSTSVTFTNYRNYKQAAELLRLVDNAMKQTDDWKTVEDFSGVDGSAGTDNESACGGRNTNDLYNTLVKELEKKSVTIDNNIKTFLGSIYHADGATLHTSPSKNSSKNTWTNTVTYTTSDYKGYLAQIGKASAVESSAEMSVKYSISMKGDVYYQNGCDEMYHHQLWPASLPVSAPATNSSNTEMKSKVNEHISKLNTYINMEYADMLEMSESALDATVTELNTAISNHVTYVGAQSTYDSLYADYAAGIANFRSSVESAKAFADFMPTVDAWNAFVAANPNYGVFQYPNFGVKGSEGHTKLLADYATFKAYRDYLLTGGSIYKYLVDNHYIDETYYTNFFDNVVAYDLQDSKDAADALYAQYSAVNPGMEETELSLEEKTIAFNSFAGFINNIGNYSAQVVAAVYTSGYQYLIDMREYFKCEINTAVLYFAENAYKSFTDMSTTAIWNEINVAKGHQADLNTLYDEVKGNAGQDKADQLLATLKADAATMIENLYKTLADRFTLEVNNAWAVYVELGQELTLNVEKFLKLSPVIVAIEPAIYTGLETAGKNGYVTSETKARYDELMKVGGIYEAWNAYASTFGFPDYKQTQIQYADRTPMEGDELKTANDPVTEAEMLKLIAALDKIITSDTVGGLLGGLLGAEEGEAFNLGTMLTDLIKGALFTDDFINTVVQMLYPLVLKEFDKVWAGLPQTVPYSGMNVKVQYVKTLHTILQEGEFEIYPDLLASRLEKRGQSTKYADNIAILKSAGGESDAWESPRLVDVETGKLKLSWGVAEQAEKLAAGEITQAEFDKFFYDAFEDATSGLLPLLTSLITKKAWAPAQCKDIGRANPGILGIMLDISLQLGSEAHNGYADFLVPIYEILGVEYTAVSTIASSTYNSDVSYVLEQILKPVFAFLDKLGKAPVDTLLEVLPDLVYALAFRMAKPALNMLRTRITYDASASMVGSVLADGADVKVGDMLITDAEDALLPNSMFAGGLNTILAHFGLNIPAIDQATLATLGKLETMSTNRTTWIYDNTAIGAGKAYTIKADKADVGYYLLSYILGIVKDPASLSQILGLFMTQKDADGNPVLDAEGKKIPDTAAIAKLQETMYADDGLNLDEINVGNAIAAIVELANQPEYIIDAYNWYAGEYSSPVGESVAMDIYLNPGNDWTEAKAEYLYNNLETLLTSVLTMAGADFNLETTIGDALNGIFTNETVTALAKLLGSLSDLEALLAPKAEEEAPEASEPETVAEGEEATEEAAGLDLAEILTDLLKNELGIDLSVYAQYANIAEGEVVDFGVTDAETFVAALTELLKPLKNVVDFILGGKDLTLIDSAITLQGYNGYNNAIIPLLEALGATPVVYTENADTLALTLSALVGVINKITTNDPEVAKDGAIYTIIDMLPGVIYYISSNALSQGIDKLLTPVYAILDTIRPIYNVDLGELLAGIEVDFDKDGVKEPLGLDLKNINWEFIFGLLNDLLGLDLSALQQVIYDVAKSIGVTYTSASTLGTFKKGAYTDAFSQADMLTVILSFVLEWATVADNAAKLDEMLGTNGIIASLGKVFADVEIAYGTPNWFYYFENEAAFDAYIESGEGLPNTLAALDWDAITENEWDLETAKYFAENIDVLVDTVIAMINADKEDAPKTLAALVSGLLTDYINADTINELVGLITGLLGDIDENLIATAGYLLDVDLVGLKAYTCDKEITTISEFAAELAYVLDTYAGGLINWLFFGDDYRFAKKSDKTDTIVINGGLGYEKGLAMILEALGADAPAAAEATTANVLAALATRVEAILANPVDEVIGLLPNLVYFLNANGAGVAVSNLLAPVYVLLDKLSAFGLEVNLTDLIGIDLANLSLANIVEIVEGATDLPLDAAEEILVNFCTGKIEKGEFIYKMSTTPENTITILLNVALNLVTDKAFAAKLDEMLGTDFIAQLDTVFAPSNIEYTAPEWDYKTNDKYGDYLLQYPNNWTKETADYVTSVLTSAEFDALIASLIEDGKYESLGALLTDKVNVFTSENLDSLVGLITNLLGGIDDGLLEAAGVLLNVDVVGLKAYKAPEGIVTVDAFAAELANVLNTYAKGVVEWLLLGNDYTFFVDGSVEYPVDVITISGAHGYSEGLALLLEALGCENLPAATGETEAIVTGVLTSLAARINAIFANPVEEVINLLPNLVYFLNTNGVAAVIDNLTAAVVALLDKLAVFGLNVDINELIDLKALMGLEDTNAAISLDNLSMAAVLEAVGLMVGLDLTEVTKVLVGFDLGEVAAYTTVSDAEAVGTAKKMSYSDSFLVRDMVTILANVALITLADEANAEFVKGLVGEDIYAIILAVLAIDESVAYEYAEWLYTDKADTDYEFSALGEADFTYGPNYTEKEAQYIADHFGTFVDNIINLLGIQINGKYVNSLSDLVTDLVGGSLYNSSNVVAIQDALAGLLDGIANLEVEGVVVGGYIVEVLKKSLGIDITAVAKVNVPEFTNNKAAFIAALADVLDPLGPILNWLLTDKDIAFFTDVDKTAFVQLPGAKGYQNGIVLLLEALGIEKENIVDPATLNEDADGADIVIAIVEPLLNRLDEILANPADEIFAILPNLVYFINSKGVDVVVKNTLNSVYTIISAINTSKAIDEIDLYDIVGGLIGVEDFDKAIVDFDLLVEVLLTKFEIAGFSFEGITGADLAGLTTGTLISYDSFADQNAEGSKKAYKMVYGGKEAQADMVTSILVLLIKFVTTEGNQEAIVALLESIGMTAEGKKYVAAMIEFLATCIADTKLGMDAALYSIYYVYYGVDMGAAEVVKGKDDLSKQWQAKLEELNKNSPNENAQVGDLLTDIFDIIFETDDEGENGVLDNSGVASQGGLTFFQKIAKFFQEIADFFRNLFSFGK